MLLLFVPQETHTPAHTCCSGCAQGVHEGQNANVGGICLRNSEKEPENKQEVNRKPRTDSETTGSEALQESLKTELFGQSTGWKKA